MFDAAAKNNGKSLNDALLPGPSQQNELTHVLTKFREGVIGFGADIEAMFSRIYDFVRRTQGSIVSLEKEKQ